MNLKGIRLSKKGRGRDRLKNDITAILEAIPEHERLPRKPKNVAITWKNVRQYHITTREAANDPNGKEALIMVAMSLGITDFDKYGDNNSQVGELTKIDDLREIWPNEAQSFTPWLALNKNLKMLSDTIGLDLELQTIEKEVGPFRADLFCKNTQDNSHVLIENQIERTDHLHLGQLLTYASGLEAATIIWIAKKFTDEHRSALDWLNHITSGEFSFFGLEVELWRIGSSAAAPKFNIVSKPNNWMNINIS